MLQKPFTGERMGAPPPSRASIRSTEISSLLFLMSQSITIIGIDPGSRNTGWGVVREVSGVLQLVDCGVIRLTESSLPGSGSSLRKCIGCSAV